MKIIGWIFILMFLVGCESSQVYKQPLSKKPRSPQVPYDYKPPKVKVEKEAVSNPVIETYPHGRFNVLVFKDGSRVIDGGVFFDLPLLTFSAQGKHVFVINYQTKELMYYRRGDKGYDPVIGYAVVTPSADVLSQSIVRGKVTMIDTKPPWTPTANIRRKHPYLPAGTIPYGHPDNAMGEAKFVISWQGVKGWEFKHVHGTSGYPSGNLWEESTFGCTRLENRAILKLLDLLGPKDLAVKEGIEVIVHSGVPEEVFDAS